LAQWKQFPSQRESPVGWQLAGKFPNSGTPLKLRQVADGPIMPLAVASCGTNAIIAISAQLARKQLP